MIRVGSRVLVGSSSGTVLRTTSTAMEVMLRIPGHRTYLVRWFAIPESKRENKPLAA